MEKILFAFSLCLIIFFLPSSLHCETVQITLLHTNDFHSNFLRADAVIATVESLRKQYPHSILLDAGDMFESKNPKALLSRGDAIVEFMNRAGYDGMTLGDNAFTGFSLPDIQRCMKRFRFPVLSSNLIIAESNEPLALPYWIYPCGKASVGVIGVYDEENLSPAGIAIAKPKTVLRYYIEKLKDKVDCLVVLSHEGLEKDRKLAESEKGIDVIIGGSSNAELFTPEIVGESLIVQAGSLGKYVGVLILHLDLEKNKIRTWKGWLELTAKE